MRGVFKYCKRVDLQRGGGKLVRDTGCCAASKDRT